MVDFISNESYRFLKTNPDLSDIIYLTLSGSHAYGTSLPNSDIDLRGVLIEQPKYIYGLQTFEQFEDLPTDTVIFGLKKFIKLCTNSNPNALELLGTDQSSIIKITEKGELLRNNSGLFLSKMAIQSFGNYATAQLRRLQNALCHDSYTESEKSKHLSDTLNLQLAHFRGTYTEFKNGSIKIYENSEGRLDFDINLKSYPVKDFVGIYSELSNIVSVYNKLNHRNNKKGSKHLYKHAMHLIRLLITGTDILNGEGIITKRPNEHDLLMGVRNGVYSFDEVFELTNEFQEKFEEAAKNTKLPDKPDMAKIEGLLFALYS